MGWIALHTRAFLIPRYARTRSEFLLLYCVETVLGCLLRLSGEQQERSLLTRTNRANIVATKYKDYSTSYCWGEGMLSFVLSGSVCYYFDPAALRFEFRFIAIRGRYENKINECVHFVHYS